MDTVPAPNLLTMSSYEIGRIVGMVFLGLIVARVLWQMMRGN